MPFWSDLFRVWNFAFRADPIEKQAQKDIVGAGVTQPDAIPDIRQDGSFWGGGRGLIRLRDTNDFVDLSSVTNRTSRYKEYERLRNMSEIEAVMDVYADESCLAGHMLVATLFFGMQTIKWLADHKPKERFLVYCWDDNIKDYTLGWAYDARKVKTAKTVRVLLDDGSNFIVTPEHRVLLMNDKWTMAGMLEFGDELKPFYREQPNVFFNEKIKVKQYPRIFTYLDGWKTERQFIDEWRTGKEVVKKEFKEISKLASDGLTIEKICNICGRDKHTVHAILRREGFSIRELRQLGKKTDRRRVIGVEEWKEIDVYDLSVEKYENFCGLSMIYHNCQRGENDHIFDIRCENEDVKKELEFLCFHREMIDFDDPSVGWNYIKKTYIFGDHFFEIIMDPENPKKGILGIQELPCDSVYRIETTKGKLVEFQQSNEGPDYQSLTRAPVTQATEADLMQATAVRFTPEQVVHTKIGDDRRTFYPYGVSLIEPARGPAHQLRLMEDAMVVYRLCVRTYDKCFCRKSVKNMGDVVVGDEVRTLTENGFVWSKVIWTKKHGVKPIWKLTTKFSEIGATEDHPILIVDGRTKKMRYRAISKIRPEYDKVVVSQGWFDGVPKKIDRILTEPYARLTETQREYIKTNVYNQTRKNLIIEGLQELNLYVDEKSVDRAYRFVVHHDAVSLPLNVAQKICQKLNVNPDDLIIHNKQERIPERINCPEYVTEDFARLFGFLLGDGCIEETINSKRVMFACSGDEMDNEYKQLMEKFFGRAKFRQDKRKRPGIGDIACSSITAINILRSLDYHGKAKTKRIPSWVFEERPEIRKAVVRGIADADGVKREYKGKWWWASTIVLHNENLIWDIKAIWTSLGLWSSRVTKRWTPERMIGNDLAPAAWSYTIRIADRPLPEAVDVISVQKDGEAEVCDIGVENESQNFVCNGLMVHNSRAPERRVFYIDVGNLSPARAEAFMERIKDQFRKKKVSSQRGGGLGASGVEERWHPPAIDEDYWLPIRPNATNTKIDTLPGASNLGEVDDTLYFRNKLFTALKFPQNYFTSEDPQASKVSLSSQNVRFSRTVERLQAHISKSIVQICERHLQLRGVPKEDYEDLQIIFTPPSEWRELSRQEIINNRMSWAGSLKGSMIMADYDILIKILHYTEEETQEMQSRLKIQKLEDFKLQVLSQNPSLLGIGLASSGEKEIGTEPGGPNPMLGGEQPPPAPGAPPTGAAPPPTGATSPALAEASPEEIKKYDLEIQSYSQEQDVEERDFSTEP